MEMEFAISAASTVSWKRRKATALNVEKSSPNPNPKRRRLVRPVITANKSDVRASVPPQSAAIASSEELDVLRQRAIISMKIAATSSSVPPPATPTVDIGISIPEGHLRHHEAAAGMSSSSGLSSPEHQTKKAADDDGVLVSSPSPSMALVLPTGSIDKAAPSSPAEMETETETETETATDTTGDDHHCMPNETPGDDLIRAIEAEYAARFPPLLSSDDCLMISDEEDCLMISDEEDDYDDGFIRRIHDIVFPPSQDGS